MLAKLIHDINSHSATIWSDVKDSSQKKKKKKKQNQKTAGHQAYNPSYSGGRDQEDRGSKPAQSNGS
jgi:hypothetical protein